MTDKKLIGVWFYPDQMGKFLKIADDERRSQASTLRVMLEDYVSGKLVPAEKQKAPEVRKMVSVGVNQSFKDRLLKKLEQEGMSLPEAVEGLIATKLKR